MSEKVYIARNYRSKFDAAGKAKMDCETVLQNAGWRNLGFKQTWISNAVIGTLLSAFGVTWALLRLPRRSTLCLQYPFNKFYRYSVWGARLKNCKIVTIVHDVVSLKKRHLDPRGEIQLLSKSASLILHTKAMQAWFEEQDVHANIIELGAFDYLHQENPAVKKTPANFDKLRLVFAGNMGAAKSFLYDLDSLEATNFKFDLYGIGFIADNVKDPQNTLLDYKGVFPADQVIDRIDGDFGLVWYGNSLDSCDGETGQYMKYNSPHKLSLYVLCDMPIIVWDKAAMADFVEQNGIGIRLKTLRELPEKLAALTPEQFAQMRANVQTTKAKMIAGGYLQDALDSALATVQKG